MSTTLLLVPLEDIVVFPNMDVTLTVDVGDEERVLLVPRHEGEYANVGTVAEVVDRVRLPGGGRAVALTGLHRGDRRRRAHRRRAAGCASRSRSGPTRSRPSTGASRSSSASTARSSRRSSSCAATTAASPPSSARSPSRARSPTRSATRPTSPSSRRSQLLEAVDVRERLELAVCAPARAAGRAAGAPAHPRRRRVRRRRSSSASTSCASRWSRSARSSARTRAPSSTSTARRSRRPACPRRSASRPSASSRRLESIGRAEPRGVDHPHLPRLAARRAVGEALRGAARPACTRARCSTPTTTASRT